MTLVLQKKLYRKRGEKFNIMREIIVFPFSNAFNQNEIFNINSSLNFENRLLPYKELRRNLIEKGFSINTYDMYNNTSIPGDGILLSFNHHPDLFRNIGLKFKYKRRILVAQEPLSRENFLLRTFEKYYKVLTWNKNITETERIHRISAYPIVKVKFAWISLEQRKLLTNISINKKSRMKGELYSERVKTIKLAEKIFGSQFELYGIGWDKPTNLIDKIMNYKPPLSYKGSLKEKYPKLREFKFALCYENNRLLQGNVSEKIFDCFQCGVIPLYWGAPDVLDFIPEETFIWREKFKSNEEILLYIKNLSEKEIEMNLGAIKTFLNSKRMEPYWYQNHIQVIIDTILNLS